MQRVSNDWTCTPVVGNSLCSGVLGGLTLLPHSGVLAGLTLSPHSGVLAGLTLSPHSGVLAGLTLSPHKAEKTALPMVHIPVRPKYQPAGL